MNFFQRLSYLKTWYDNNHDLYIDNRKTLKTAFDKKYKNELKRYTSESKRLKRKRVVDITHEKSLSYQDWVERHFQKLLKELSGTVLDFRKKELLDDFDIWQKDFATLDYKFRIYSLELFYKVELSKYNAQFDRYIKALKEAQVDWLFDEDEKFKLWSENHPLYKELQELEYQYDSFADDDMVGQNYTFNKSTNTQKKNLKFEKAYHPRTKDSLSIGVEKPATLKQYQASYF